MKKSLLSLLFLSSIASANISNKLSQMGPVDVAIDLKNGVTYIQAKKQNPGGQIYVLDSQTGVVLNNDLYAHSMVVKNQDTEIELIADGKLLSKVNDELMILNPVKLGEKLIWETSYLNNEEIEDFADIKNIKFESNGLLSFEAYSREAQDNVIAFFSFVKKGNDTVLQKEKVLIASVAMETLDEVADEVENESDQKVERSNSLGFTAGMIAGLGLSYRRYFSNKFGLHVGAIVFGDEDSINANLGVQVLRTVRQNEKSRLYLLAGSAVFWDRYQAYNYSEPQYPEVRYDPETGAKEVIYSEEYPKEEYRTVNDYMLNFGLGFGMELAGKQGIGVALEVPITITFASNNEMGEGMSFKQAYPIPALTIFYRF